MSRILKILSCYLFMICSLCACRPEKPAPAPKNEPYYDKASAFWDKQNDSAFYYFSKATLSSKEPLQTAKAYYAMAEIQSDAGDDFGSQESLLQSLKTLHENDPANRRCLLADYNELGLTSFNLRAYTDAIRYYGKALQFCDDSTAAAIIRNNTGNAWQYQKDYPQALTLYKKAISQLKPGSKEYARVLSNQARTLWLQNPAYPVATQLRTALRIRQRLQDLNGENASYAHLTDYYSKTKPDSALYYAQELYRTARQLHSADDRLDALRQLVKLSPPGQAQTWFKSYQQLSDSLQHARSSARNQFALIRYESEKNRSDNLRLQKDNTDKRYELLQKNILLYSSGGIFLLLTGTAIAWYRKRKQRLELQARERELGLSQKVHDEVANGLYRLLKKVENEKEPKQADLLDDIEELYERSRDISYDTPDITPDNFHESLSELSGNLSGSIRLAITGSEPELWEHTNNKQRRELGTVLEELLINADKHSGANTVTLSFHFDSDNLQINCSDNGRGFPENLQKGTGLRSTENRIKRLGGTLTLAGKAPKGALIQILIPIN